MDASPRATTYVVTLQDQSTGQTISSPPVTGNEWAPDQPLTRGTTYAWQVAGSRCRRNGNRRAEASGSARQVHGGGRSGQPTGFERLPASHLVRGVLYANAGLLDDAERELAALSAQNPNSEVADRLLKADSRISTMTISLRVFFVAVCASALGAAALLAQTPAPADNLLEFVIGNGPHAGTYKLSTSDIMCMHFKQRIQVAAAFKDFDASDLKKIGEAGINIVNPDEAGPKRGNVLVAFGVGATKVRRGTPCRSLATAPARLR